MASSSKESNRDARTLLDLAKNTPHDLYALLDLHPTPKTPSDATSNTATATDPSSLAAIPQAQIAKAHRKAAAAHHPDNPRNRERKDAATEIFHHVKEAWSVLGDVEARQAYDERLAAQFEREAREGLLEGRRRAAFADLKRREGQAAANSDGNLAAGAKRKRGDVAGGSMAEGDELAKIAAMGARLRMEKEERRRREREAERKQQQEQQDEDNAANGDNHSASHITTTTQDTASPKPQPAGVSDLSRTIKVRWQRTGVGSTLDSDALSALFARFGPIESAILLKDKNLRPTSNHRPKHPNSPAAPKAKKQLMGTACLVFASIVGAHAAVLDAPKLISAAYAHTHAHDRGDQKPAAEDDAGDNDAVWSLVDSVSWAAGNAVDGEHDTANPARQTKTDTDATNTPTHSQTNSTANTAAAAPPRPRFNPSSAAAPPNSSSSAAPPSFASFTPSAPVVAGTSFEERTLMKLKEAERRREMERIRVAEGAV